VLSAMETNTSDARLGDSEEKMQRLT
jgi:hypothetical protein